MNEQAEKKKPLAIVPLDGKLERQFFRRELERRAHSRNVRTIGPFQSEYSGMNSITLVHTDLLDGGITLGELLTADEKSCFSIERNGHIFRAKLEEYVQKCDIRSGQSYLECALVYGYPLVRALSMEGQKRGRANQ